MVVAEYPRAFSREVEEALYLELGEQLVEEYGNPPSSTEEVSIAGRIGCELRFQMEVSEVGFRIVHRHVFVENRLYQIHVTLTDAFRGDAVTSFVHDSFKIENSPATSESAKED